jgi:hypothetical protein
MVTGILGAMIMTAVLPGITSSDGSETGYPIPDPPRQPHLLGNVGVEAGYSCTDIAEPCVETTAERLRAGGDGKGDEHEEHGVLGSCGTALMPQKVFDQITHLTSPWRNGVRPDRQ